MVICLLFVLPYLRLYILISGELRFAHPQPAEGWGDQVLNADTLPNACTQNVDNIWIGYPGRYVPNTNVSEDCLYLNVHAPRSTTQVSTHGINVSFT